MYYRLDSENNVVPCTMEEFHDWHFQLPQDDATGVGKYVNQDWLGKTLVSTIFIGLTFDPNRVFETMVFLDPDDSMSESDSRLYSNYSDAIKGHQEMLEKWSEKLNIEI